MKYIDIHCHLDFPDYDKDREEILKEMQKEEIVAITIGADLERSKKAVEIAEQNEKIWACVGIHPDEIGGEVEKLEDLLKSPKVVGVGECGLDYFGDEKTSNKDLKEKQKELFKYQIDLALDYNKPLMLHVRSSGKNNFDAYEDTLEILKEYKNKFGEKLRGNVHFFAADKNIAKEFLDLGFTFSFTGVITFTSDYDEVIKYLPIDSIMSETDAPFVAPTPFRGKRNSPLYVPLIVKKMAEIKGKTEEEMSQEILKNAKRLFAIHI